MIDYFPSYRVKNKKIKDRDVEPAAIILHSTPVPDRRVSQYTRVSRLQNTPSRYETLQWVYRTGRIKAEDHIVCGDKEGDIFIACPLNKIAWHVGSRDHWRYNRWWKAKDRYQWWADTWCDGNAQRGVTPKTLWPKVWKNNSVNNNTIGIGFIVPPGSREPLTQGHITNLHTALDYIQVFFNESTPDLMLRHKDIHPISRTSSRGTGYDLYDEQISKGVLECLV